MNTKINTNNKIEIEKSIELTKRQLSDEDKPQYNLLQKLGYGKTSTVYKCQQKNTNDYFAIKKFTTPKSSKNDIQLEIDALLALNHDNIIKTKNLNDKNNGYIILEYMENGELFDYVLQAGKKFPKSLCKFYFKQLLDALACAHKHNYCHRDIKLENCLLDENFDLKLSDFGFACQNTQGSYQMDRILGTDGYMAPEMCKNEKYCGFQTDIFALGVVLFIMNQGFPPFYRKPLPNDPYYKFFDQGKQDRYWYNLKNKYNLTIEDDFIDLINRMIDPNPQQRIKIEEIYQHPFLQNCEFMGDNERISYMQTLKKEMSNNNN